MHFVQSNCSSDCVVLISIFLGAVSPLLWTYSLSCCGGPAEYFGGKALEFWGTLVRISKFTILRKAMEVFGKSMVPVPTNVIYLSSLVGQNGPNPVHMCDWKCENEHVFGNMYRCKLTGVTHVCDKNCNQRIIYDNHSSLCRVSRQIFPLTPSEQQAVRGIRRKLDFTESCPPADTCAFKRRRNAHIHPSPFEKAFSAVSPICSQVGDGMDMS